MPGRNRFSYEDPESARRLLAQLGLGDSLNDDADEERDNAGLGERTRRPYGGVAETTETFQREPSASSSPEAIVATGLQDFQSSEPPSAHEVRHNDPLLDAIIESSRAQVDSMAKEIVQWKRTMDQKEAELAHLRDAVQRLLAERQEMQDQIKAIRKIVEPKPEGMDLPPLRSHGLSGANPKSKPEDPKITSKPASAVNPEIRAGSNTNGNAKTQAAHGKTARNPDSSSTIEEPKSRRAPYRYRSPRKPHHPRPDARPRRPKTIFDLPKVAIDSIAWHLCPPANPLQRLDPVRETSALFDEVWNADLDAWARTCTRFSRILRGTYRWKVLKFDDEDPIGWHEKVERMPQRIRPFVQALEFERAEADRSYEISTDRDDYDDYARLFPNLCAIRHHGQIKRLRITSNLSDYTYDHPLDVVDMVHTTSLVGDNDLKPDAKPTPLKTLILRDGTALPTNMVYADLKPYRRDKPDATWLTHALAHFIGIENLVLHVHLKEDALHVEREKTPLRVLRTEELPALRRVEVRFVLPYAYGARDVSMLNGFQDFFKRFSSNIEQVTLIVTLEPAAKIKAQVTRFRQQHRPAHLTYWGIVKTHYIPPVDRLEKFVVKLTKDLPRLTSFEFRVEDNKADPEPLVRYSANVEGADRTLHKVYRHRMPKGYPDLPDFWGGQKPESLWDS